MERQPDRMSIGNNCVDEVLMEMVRSASVDMPPPHTSSWPSNRLIDWGAFAVPKLERAVTAFSVLGQSLSTLEPSEPIREIHTIWCKHRVFVPSSPSAVSLLFKPSPELQLLDL